MKMITFKAKSNNVINPIFLLGGCMFSLASGTAMGSEKNNVAPAIVVSDNLIQCLSIEKDKERLLCFDNVTKSLKRAIVEQGKHSKIYEAASVVNTKSEASTTTLASVNIKPVERTRQQKIDEFAKDQVVLSSEEQAKVAAKELTEFNATVSSLHKLIRGEWVINLDNGQKWQQIGVDRLTLKVGYLVTIRKGALGAIYLSSEKSSRKIRVKRKK